MELEDYPSYVEIYVVLKSGKLSEYRFLINFYFGRKMASLRREFLLMEDNDDSDFFDFVAKRHHMLFRPGDMVRIAHGKFMVMDDLSLHTPPDADSDPTIGAFGKVEFVKNSDGEDTKDYNEDDPPFLVIRFEQEWEPRVRSYYSLRDVMDIEAGDVVNYTVLGEEDGDKLYEKSRDRNLDFYDTFKSQMIPDDFRNYALEHCDDDSTSEMFLRFKEHELDRLTISIYTEMYNELIKLNRKFRWLVTYKKIFKSRS